MYMFIDSFLLYTCMTLLFFKFLKPQTKCNSPVCKTLCIARIVIMHQQSHHKLTDVKCFRINLSDASRGQEKLYSLTTFCIVFSFKRNIETLVPWGRWDQLI